MGILFDKLSATERNMIDDYRYDYGFQEVDLPFSNRASLDYVLRFWDKEKEDLFHMFGDQFIIEKDIEFSSPVIDIQSAMQTDTTFCEMRRVLCKEMGEAMDALDLPLRSGYRPEYRLILSDVLNFFDLAQNKSSIYEELPLPNGKFVTINSETKLLKSIGKLVKGYGLDEEYFEKFRQLHSQFLNKKKLTGTLCLSIHPLDYMTMSDNNNGWTSCMSWENAGCYRRGTVEMMNSNCVVVGYLKSDSVDLSIGDSNWNSKKWRSLFIVDPNFICSVKNYPYPSEDLTLACLNWLEELASKYYDTSYQNTKSFNEEGFDFQYEGVSKSLGFSTYDMYNDFGTTIHYIKITTAIDSFVRNCFGVSNYYDFCYSGNANCMFCGEEGSFEEDEGYVTCCNCSEGSGYICSCCGERLRSDDDYIEDADGNIYCQDCADERLEYCEICSEYFPYEVCENYVLVPDVLSDEDAKTLFELNHSTHKFNTISVYNNAFNYASDYVLSNHFKFFEVEKKRKYFSTWNGGTECAVIVHYSDLTRAGFRLFGIWDDDELKEYESTLRSLLDFNGEQAVPAVAELGTKPLTVFESFKHSDIISTNSKFDNNYSSSMDFVDDNLDLPF